MDESLSFSLRQDLSFPLCLSADHKRVTVEGSFQRKVIFFLVFHKQQDGTFPFIPFPGLLKQDRIRIRQ